MAGDVLTAAALGVLAIEVGGLLYLVVTDVMLRLSEPDGGSYGLDVFVGGVALAAVPVGIGLWRRRRLAWIVFVPYAIFALSLLTVEFM